jgi:hypothetical protein
MSVKDLLKLVLPPRSPFEADLDADWDSVEHEIGLTLPQDYKEFINEFGTGQTAGFIWVLNPFSNIDQLNLLVHIFEQYKTLDNLRSLKEKSDDYCPYPLYPEPSGLLPWGYTDNGGTLFWLTTGEPNSWPVVVNDHGDTFERFALPMTTFLAKFIKKELESDIMVTVFTNMDNLFEPVDLEDNE